MTTETPRIVAIVPARGGSKGLLKKNLSLLNGKPLISYAIRSGLECDAVERVIVSTDDKEIAAVSAACGAEVPFLRPAALAQDDTPDRPVFVHLIEWLKDNESYTFDYLVNLRCTTPLRTPAHIGKAIKAMLENPCESLRTVDRIEGKHHPYWMFKRNDEGYGTAFVEGIQRSRYYRRQLLPPAYSINALVDIMQTETVVKNENLYGEKIMLLETDPLYSVDIDTEKDLLICEAVLQVICRLQDAAVT